MAAETFGALWREVAMHASSCPPLLCRSWLKDAYQTACQGRRWSFLRRSTKLLTAASRAITCVATQGADTLPGTFLAVDLHRQIRAGNTGLPYTIMELDAGLTTATLDQAYRGTTGSTAFTILDAYLVMPADFDGCRTLKNLTNQQPMPWWYTDEHLDYFDPNRIWSDATARMIVARTIQQGVTTLLGRVLYEWWPYPTGEASYDFTYYARPDPADTDRLQGALVGRGGTLVKGALAEAALYPGNAEQKNPYFNQVLANQLSKQYEMQLQELCVRDDDVLPGEQYQAIDWRWVMGMIPMDTRMLRSTDATLADYAGSGYGYGF